MFVCVCALSYHTARVKKGRECVMFCWCVGGWFFTFSHTTPPCRFPLWVLLTCFDECDGLVVFDIVRFLQPHTHPRFHPLLFDSLLPCNECAGSELNAQAKLCTNFLQMRDNSKAINIKGTHVGSLSLSRSHTSINGDTMTDGMER